MISAVLRLPILLLSGAALFALWKTTMWRHRLMAAIVTAGFLIRATTALALFWVSYLRLPLAPSLQLGNGFWFFGLDGLGFFNFAVAFVEKGARAVILIDKTTVSYFYVQILSIAVAALGAQAAVSILLNSFAYLGTCALILRWNSDGKRRNEAAVIALTIVAFTPSWILWAAQPMKDPVFIFFVVAFFYALTRFCRALASARPLATGPLLFWIGVLMVTLYAVSGIRWYVGAMGWCVSGAAMALTVLHLRPAPWRALLVGTAAFVLMSQALRYGSGPYMPDPIEPVFHTPPTLQAVTHGFTAIVTTLEDSRKVQEKYIGTTTLQQPPVIRKAPWRPPVRRLISAALALVLPRFVGTRVGLLQVGGGRGLWLFADLDTVAFDVAALVVAAFLVASGRAQIGPLFVPLLLMTIALTGAIAYVSTNYGTLFRHRAMVLVCLSLLPLVRPAMLALRGFVDDRYSQAFDHDLKARNRDLVA